MAKENAEKIFPAATFSKAQLLGSARFIKHRDLLGAPLKDDKRYTIAEAESAIGDYMKGKVK